MKMARGSKLKCIKLSVTGTEGERRREKCILSKDGQVQGADHSGYFSLRVRINVSPTSECVIDTLLKCFPPPSVLMCARIKDH